MEKKQAHTSYLKMLLFFILPVGPESYGVVSLVRTESQYVCSGVSE